MADGTPTPTTTDTAKAAYSAALKAKAPQRELATLAIAVARSTDRLAVRQHWTGLAERHAAYVVDDKPAPVAVAVIDGEVERLRAEVARLQGLVMVAAEDNERQARARAAIESDRDDEKARAETFKRDLEREREGKPAADDESKPKGSGVPVRRFKVPAVVHEPKGEGPWPVCLDVGALKAIAPFMSEDSTRFNLQGIYLARAERDGKTFTLAVATDGHTLACVTLTEGYEGPPVIVPADIVRTACRARKVGKAPTTVELTVDSDAKGCSVVGLALPKTSGTLVDGQYPNFYHVIPKEDYRPSVVALSGRYMARVGDAAVTMQGGDKGASVECHSAVDDLSPSVFQVCNPSVGELLMIVMPMRR